MVGRNISLKNPVTLPGIDPGTVRLVALFILLVANTICYFLSLLHHLCVLTEKLATLKDKQAKRK